MYKQVSLLALLVLMLTLVSPESQMQAAMVQQSQARPAPVTYFRIQGELATADFAALVDGCLYNEAGIFVGALTSKDGPGAPTGAPTVSVFISSRNLCTGEWPIFALGSAPLPTDWSPIDPQLTAAHVQSSVVVNDNEMGTSYTLLVDLTWAGTGDLIRSRSHQHGHAPGCTTTFRQSDRYRSAAITGSISSTAMNFTAGDLLFAQLHSLKQGNITVGCSAANH